ncbi:conserved hypothetical protein [Talaromyces stipitatus ATCC 10500]|uniref:Uncharacterized protein n=1 Tax=Talaromyces stipitatus (strain ATCC 10500 / CBS 375.48 / QM 6759 / NRRL 1006) TaxID=441959 RepID=B8MAA5_TALSN|nr:uncharacterized protein TSTA_123400 [Talaromyces stipitatus ATCC 10500]EED18607.1 conserved hypothetical protein [Talaromyces stipitatus ATCC 10500]
MEQHFSAVEEELRSIKAEALMLRQRNARLTDEINYRIKSEMKMESALTGIKTELEKTQQEFDQTETVARDNAPREGGEIRTVNHEIVDFLYGLTHEYLSLKETLRRERELSAEARQAATESANHYQKVATDLMTKLNSLQTREEALYDEQCSSEWRKLQQDLDSWTRRTFRDKSVMGYMTLTNLRRTSSTIIIPEDMLKNVQGKRAYIQGFIAGIIFDTVFRRLFVLSPTIRSGRLLTAVGKVIRGSESSQAWETWRSTTSRALGDRHTFSNRRLNNACNQLVQSVEALFSEYYSPGVQKEVVNKGLRQIFEDCVAFKKKLEYQEFDYDFRRSLPGAAYSSEYMNSSNYVEEDGSIVQISIWASLYKVAFNNEELLIEPEAVWTSQPDPVGDAEQT